jgi:hypothetical protein
LYPLFCPQGALSTSREHFIKARYTECLEHTAQARAMLVKGSEAGLIDVRHSGLITSIVRLSTVASSMRVRQGEGEAWLNEALSLLERGDLEKARAKFSAACEAMKEARDARPDARERVQLFRRLAQGGSIQARLSAVIDEVAKRTVETTHADAQALLSAKYASAVQLWQSSRYSECAGEIAEGIDGYNDALSHWKLPRTGCQAPTMVPPHNTHPQSVTWARASSAESTTGRPPSRAQSGSGKIARSVSNQGLIPVWDASRALLDASLRMVRLHAKKQEAAREVEDARGYAADAEAVASTRSVHSLRLEVLRVEGIELRV